jgi:hypothetical protein
VWQGECCVEGERDRERKRQREAEKETEREAEKETERGRGRDTRCVWQLRSFTMASALTADIRSSHPQHVQFTDEGVSAVWRQRDRETERQSRIIDGMKRREASFCC